MDRGYRVLSLFDGMGCAQLAMMGAGLSVERYVAFEVDRFCNEVVAHNFPWAEQRGDVFDADFTEFEGFDFLMGGSPCTYWSVGQSADRREVTASGMGWDLFQQYVRALREAKPRWFIYENNKSMSRAIRESISAEFGFEPIWINSALVSAQKRDRLYWVGRRGEDGTYSQVRVEQPADRGILLRDVLETGEAWKDKQQCLDANYYKGGTVELMADGRQSGSRLAVAEPVGITEDGKSFVLPATYYKGSTPDQTLTKRRRTLVAEPVDVSGCDAKSVTVTAQGAGLAGNAGLYAVPAPEEYSPLDKNRVVVTDHNIRAAQPLRDGRWSTVQSSFVFFPECKTNVLTAGHARSNRVAQPVDAPIAGVPMYEVRDGEMEIRGRKYPTRLADGFYVIRKLSVRECMRLQTVPEWYDFSCVSKTQAYKMLGNGWTVQVIVHLIESIMEEEGQEDD